MVCVRSQIFLLEKLHYYIKGPHLILFPFLPPPITMPPTKSDNRTRPYPSIKKSTKCKECDRVPQSPKSAKTIRKTGRCHECAAKFGIDLIRELLDNGHENNAANFLALSAMIAIKFRKVSLSDDDSRHFASTFRDIANQIESRDDTRKSFWDAFWGRKTCMNIETGEDKV